MPFMDAPPGSLVSGAASKAVRRRHQPAPQDHREEARQGAQVAHNGARADDRLPEGLVSAHDHHPAEALTDRSADKTGLTEMAWDPITRIVGSLGIYTKIDFSQTARRRVPLHVVDLPRLLDLHEGQGPARRALHHQPDLRDLRRQPRHLLGLQPEHGLRRAPAAPRRVDHQPRRGRRVHVRPQHLPGEPGRGGLLREDDRGDQPRACWSWPTAPRRRTPPSTATRPSATSCGRSTRSPASSTARRCRSAGTPGRCSA